MAGNDAVWGIDIGQCSLKAIRCRQGSAPGQLLAEAFDYIAYPRILSQPGADPAQLIGEALEHFLSRNTVRGDRLAISVPGQSGLARFIKLPPVEAKKIPDIVRYEARQQIPFDLADVVWDYQRMGGGAEEEGYALETEVGLFAMKRDQVFRALEPFTNLGIEVDVVQLTPLALYNFVLFDQMHDLPPVEHYDPDDPPPSTVILSLGTDATDLVVTNGYRVWQRSIPLGGNHFTKALTKELKLTFAKAEHMKCNAAAAPDPRALFQAMRPVFNDLLTEVQRSIGYFTSIDRKATIEKVVALGNAMKMPGLRRYLAQSLGFDVIRLEEFERLAGSEVVGSPAFKENLLSFGVAYGLAVQGLGVGRGTLKTNLLPPEIVKDRFVRGKKPWALAGAALLLLGCAIGYGSHALALGSVAEKTFERAESEIRNVTGRAGSLEQEEEDAKKEFNAAQDTGKHLVGNVEDRIRWLELLRAINESLPAGDSFGERPKDPHQWKDLHLETMDSQYVADVSTWYSRVKDAYRGPGGAAPAAAADGAEAAPAGEPIVDQFAAGVPTDGSVPPAADAAGVQGGPHGPGWIIRLSGFHFHNPEATAGELSGDQYVHETLIQNLEEGRVFLPPVGKEAAAADAQNQEIVSMKELGISYPTLTSTAYSRIQPVPIRDPFADETDVAPPATNPHVPGMRPPGGASGIRQEEKTITVRRYDFVVEFCWQPTSPSDRLEKRKQGQGQPTDASGQAQDNAM